MSEKLTLDDLLIILIEECGEVIQAATKCLRFGFNVDHGVEYGRNDIVLARECGDLSGVINALPLDVFTMMEAENGKIERAEKAKFKYGRRKDDDASGQ